MYPKPMTYEKFQSTGNQMDVRSIGYFQVEEDHHGLQSGACFYLKPWCIIGMPAFLESPGKSQVSEIKIQDFN